MPATILSKPSCRPSPSSRRSAAIGSARLPVGPAAAVVISAAAPAGSIPPPRARASRLRTARRRRSPRARSRRGGAFLKLIDLGVGPARLRRRGRAEDDQEARAGQGFLGSPRRGRPRRPARCRSRKIGRDSRGGIDPCSVSRPTSAGGTRNCSSASCSQSAIVLVPVAVAEEGPIALVACRADAVARGGSCARRTWHAARQSGHPRHRLAPTEFLESDALTEMRISGAIHRRSLAAGRARSAYIAAHVSIRPWRDIERRPSRQIMVGNVAVGGDAPVTVQTMTNTPTSDAKATIDQIRRCEEAGADIIRVSCPDVESTAALRQIVRAARVPIVADIHFHYKRALEAADAGAACLRINPGNIGSDERVARSGRRRQGQRLRDPHRRQCRQPREGPARKIWRALPRGAGRKRARPYPHPRGPRFPRI